MAKRQQFILTIETETARSIVCNEHGAITFWSEGFARTYADAFGYQKFQPTNASTIADWYGVNRGLATEAGKELQKGGLNARRIVLERAKDGTEVKTAKPPKGRAKGK